MSKESEGGDAAARKVARQLPAVADPAALYWLEAREGEAEWGRVSFQPPKIHIHLTNWTFCQIIYLILTRGWFPVTDPP